MNRYINTRREFVNVADVLLGEACVQSFNAGHNGFISFKPKTNLESYYKKKFNAQYGGRGTMFLSDLEANTLN